MDEKGRRPANLVELLVTIALGGAARVLFLGRRTEAIGKDAHRRARSFFLIRPDGFGDIILTLPAISYLRRINPDAKIAMAVRPPLSQFVRDYKLVDEVIDLDFPKRSSLTIRGLLRYVRQCLALKGRFDIAYDFRGDPRNAILGALSSRRVVGERSAGTAFLLSASEPHDYGCLRAVQHLRIVALGQPEVPAFSDYEYSFQLAIGPELRERVRNMTGRLERYVIVHPGASLENRQWASERWMELASWLVRDGYPLVLTGSGASETKIAGVVFEGAQAAGGTCVNLAGKTTPTELAALVEGADAVISPDTGIAHLAHALRVPSATLFGAGSAICGGYDGPINRSISSRVACSPCWLATCPRKDVPMECMERIAVQTVYDTLQVSLRNAGKIRPTNAGLGILSRHE